MATPLAPLEPLLFRNQGYMSEADAHGVLRSSPYIVRGFEFGLADGGVDCTRRYNVDASYARRLWDVDDRDRSTTDASELALYEIKSTISEASGEQPFITTLAQRRRVAFWIGITPTDSRYVDLIPNYSQEAEALLSTSSSEGEDTYCAVNSTRVSRLPPRTYGSIDQCGTPYRMPITLLVEAIHRVRAHIRSGGQEVYVNPGSGVAFPDWRPLTTLTAKWLRPSEHSAASYSAYRFTMQLYQAVTFGPASNDLSADFIGLQPRLADLKLVLTEAQGIRQVFVQLKGDGRFRARAAGLEKVFVARGEGEKRQYYFTAFERFDFLLMYFEFSQLPDPTPRFEFFFLPEKVIPDSFYTSVSNEESFDRPEFQEYRIHMDDDWQWVRQLRKIIQTCQGPRKPGQRPVRSLPMKSGPEEKKAKQALPLQKIGQHHYKAVMEHRHRFLFYRIMEICASRMSGLLVVLATNHPYGDFAFCRYHWTDEEREEFMKDGNGRPPIVAHELPPDTPCVAVSYYARSGESSFHGPNVSAAQFRRINSCSQSRLLLWDLGAYDTMASPMLPVIIPSDDIRPSEGQRGLFSANLGIKTAQDEPNLSALLKTPLYAAEYAITPGGPLVYEGTDWLGLWELLHQLTTTESLIHPPGYVRQASLFRHPLRDLHRRLVDEHVLAGFGAAEVVDADKQDT